MSACFLSALSEVIRLTTPDVADDPVITVTLDPVADQGNRARVGARFWVAVSLSWGGDPWGSGVQVVDSRGYPVVWKYADVAKWLVKALSGAPCVVTVSIIDASQVPARWTVAREQAAAAKVSGIDAADVDAAAAAKVASVSLWANSQRKRDVIAAAENMIAAAALLRVAQAVQGGAGLDGSGGGGGGGGGTTYPNDIAGIENAVYLSPGVSVSSQLEQAGDIDWFRLDLGNFLFSLHIERFGPEPQMTGPVGVVVWTESQYVAQQWTDDLSGPVMLGLNGPGIYFVSVDANTGSGESLGQYQITLILNGSLG